MTTISELVWPPTGTALTYEQHREKLSSLGKLDATAIIKSDDTVKVTITDGNVYSFSSNLTLKSIKTTISTEGKITLPNNQPCYGVMEVLYDVGDGVIELDLYDTSVQAPFTISSNKLEITINDSSFYNATQNSPVYIKILTLV